LTPLERALIHAAEQSFQTQRHVDEVIPGTIVILMGKEFKSILASDLYSVFENARREAKVIFYTLPRDEAANSLDSVPLYLLDFSEGLSDSDAESRSNVLEKELQHAPEDQLWRNFMDSIISVAEEQICDQNRFYGYDSREISVAFQLWWQKETDA
jgi:hypothetical protein